MAKVTQIPFFIHLLLSDGTNGQWVTAFNESVQKLVSFDANTEDEKCFVDGVWFERRGKDWEIQKGSFVNYVKVLDA